MAVACGSISTISSIFARETKLKRYIISVVVCLIYFLLIATSFCYGASLHLALTANNSNEYVALNGGVVSWSNYYGDTYVMPDYEPKLFGYHSNPEVQVQYQVPLNFYAQQASIFVRTFNPYTETAPWIGWYALLDVSADGIAWNNVPTNQVVDITEYVHDATTLHFRGRLWSENGPTACQWIYTPFGGTAGFVLDAEGFDYPAPEPNTFVLLTIGGACLIILGYKRLTRSF